MYIRHLYNSRHILLSQEEYLTTKSRSITSVAVNRFKGRLTHGVKKTTIKIHLSFCFIALLILRLISKRLNKIQSPEQIVKSLRKYQVCFVKDNVFKATYYDQIIKDIGDALKLNLNRRE
jgi:hypothetical protein